MASNQSSAPAKSTPKFSFCKPLKIPEKDFSFKNTSSHHLPIVERHSKKNISQEIKFFPLLKQDRGFFHGTPANNNIKQVTARGDIHSSLFALDFCIKCLGNKKKIFDPNTPKTKSLANVKKIQKQSSIKKDFDIRRF
jgi:hypothetical protein